MGYDDWLTDPSYNLSYEDVYGEEECADCEKMEDVRECIQDVIYMIGGEIKYNEADLIQNLEYIASELNLFPLSFPLKIEERKNREVKYEVQ